jgi:glutathione S-transferase
VRKLYELQGRDDIRFSPYCWRIRMALAHKDLETELVPVQFGEKEKIAFSGQKLVPVLVDGEQVISDSWKIADYLEETYPDRPSLFGGEAGRAGARFVNCWTDSSAHVAMIRLAIWDIYDRVIVPEDREYFLASREKRFGMPLEEFSDRSEERLAALHKVMEPMRLALKSSPFLAGEKPLYMDYILFGTCKFMDLCCSLVIFPENDPISDWYGRMCDLFGGYGRGREA